MPTHVSPIVATALLAFGSAAMLAQDACAWGASRSCSGSGRDGGSYSHTSSSSGGYGSASHSGSTSYTSPSGQTYSGSHSGSGSEYGGYHGSYSGSTSSGGTYHAGYSGTAYGGSCAGYHAPCYAAPACGAYGSGFGAGMVTGAVVGAAAVAATQPAPVTNVVYATPGVYVAPQPVAPAPFTGISWPMGATLTVLPTGFTSQVVNGVQFYQCGSTWFQVQPNGAGYVVVPAP